jgi:hypothetical protein
MRKYVFHEKITGKMETLEITMLGDLLWDIQPTNDMIVGWIYRFALSPPGNGLLLGIRIQDEAPVSLVGL